jgi:hypothetical protein
MNNSLANSATKAPPSEHESASSRISNSVENLESLVCRIEKKLMPAMTPPLPTPGAVPSAVDADSPVPIVSNLHSWSRRLEHLHDELSTIYHRIAL